MQDLVIDSVTDLVKDVVKELGIDSVADMGPDLGIDSVTDMGTDSTSDLLHGFFCVSSPPGGFYCHLKISKRD
jgi:hypothetical protein